MKLSRFAKEWIIGFKAAASSRFSRVFLPSSIFSGFGLRHLHPTEIGLPFCRCWRR